MERSIENPLRAAIALPQYTIYSLETWFEPGGSTVSPLRGCQPETKPVKDAIAGYRCLLLLTLLPEGVGLKELHKQEYRHSQLISLLSFPDIWKI